MPSVPSPPLCQSRGTLPENMGKGGMRFKRESFPWGDLDLQNLSHKTTLESPNPGPLRLQQTLESPEALKNTDSWALLFWGPTSEWSRGTRICSFICFLYASPCACEGHWSLEELAESSSGRFIKFPEDSFELDNCLLFPKLIKSQGETEKKEKKQFFQILVFTYERMIEVVPNLTTILKMSMTTSGELWSWKKIS